MYKISRARQLHLFCVNYAEWRWPWTWEWSQIVYSRHAPSIFCRSSHMTINIQKRHTFLVLLDPSAGYLVHQLLAASHPCQSRELATYRLDFRRPVQTQDRPQILRTVFFPKRSGRLIRNNAARNIVLRLTEPGNRGRIAVVAGFA